MEQINPQPNPPCPCCFCAKKPLVMVLLVILLVFVFSLATYLLVKSQTPSQTPVSSPAPILSTSPSPSALNETVYAELTRSVNWETYENNNWKFLLKYPSTWKLTIDNLGDNPGGAFEANWITNSDFFFSLEYNPRPVGIVIGHLGYEEKVKIGGKEFYVYQVTTLQDGKDQRTRKLYYLGDPKEHTPTFEFAYKTKDTNQAILLINQILSTFKFD